MPFLARSPAFDQPILKNALLGPGGVTILNSARGLWRRGIAVAEPVILMAPPFLSLLKTC